MMVNTEALRIYIQGKMLAVFPDAGYEELPDDAAYPYISWVVNWISGSGICATGILEADAWDKTSDAAKLEELCDKLCKSFNNLSHIQSEFHVSIGFLRRYPVEDPNPDIRRRRMQFQIKYTGGK